MTDNLQASESLEPNPGLGVRPRGIFRRVVLPLLVIGLIVAAIWWLESRGGDDVSPTGERYGPVELPAALQFRNLLVVDWPAVQVAGRCRRRGRFTGAFS